MTVHSILDKGKKSLAERPVIQNIKPWGNLERIVEAAKKWLQTQIRDRTEEFQRSKPWQALNGMSSPSRVFTQKSKCSSFSEPGTHCRGRCGGQRAKRRSCRRVLPVEPLANLERMVEAVQIITEEKSSRSSSLGQS